MNIDVTAVAQASAVTVFVYVEHPQSTGDDFIFIDAVSLRPAAVQPTPTPVPPTATSAPRLLTPTPLPAPTATPSPAIPPPPAPTATPSATPTPTNTPRATITPTRRVPPTATPTPSAKLRASPMPGRSSITITVTVSGPLAVGLSALAGAIVLLWYAPCSYDVYLALHVLAVTLWVANLPRNTHHVPRNTHHGSRATQPHVNRIAEDPGPPPAPDATIHLHAIDPRPRAGEA